MELPFVCSDMNPPRSVKTMLEVTRRRPTMLSRRIAKMAKKMRRRRRRRRQRRKTARKAGLAPALPKAGLPAQGRPALPYPRPWPGLAQGRPPCTRPAGSATPPALARPCPRPASLHQGRIARVGAWPRPGLAQGRPPCDPGPTCSATPQPRAGLSPGLAQDRPPCVENWGF